MSHSNFADDRERHEGSLPCGGNRSDLICSSKAAKEAVLQPRAFGHRLTVRLIIPSKLVLASSSRKILIMVIMRFICAILVGLVVSNASNAVAEENNTYVIAAASGYGVEDCLGEGGECGQVVADAWCAAHGRGVAVKFGRSNASANGAAPPYFVTCGN